MQRFQINLGDSDSVTTQDYAIDDLTDQKKHFSKEDSMKIAQKHKSEGSVPESATGQ